MVAGPVQGAARTQLRTQVETAATIAVAICAVIVTLIMVRREFFASSLAGRSMPKFIKNWNAYATGDEQVGASTAVDTIVVFSDFECPYCRHLALTLRELRRSRNFMLVHRNLPLTVIHPNAHRVAVGGECAAPQGRFAAYSDSVFAHQTELGGIDLIRLAASAGVRDVREFRRCLESRDPERRLREDSIAAAALKILVTPTLLVNGWLLQGTPPESLLVRYFRDTATALPMAKNE
jgi:predicted DsbA family dithiol-disulfide isomerase